VIEALATGLPVLFADSGGNRELAGDFGHAISGDVAESADNFIAELAGLQDKLKGNVAKFGISHAAEHYVQAFESAVDAKSTRCTLTARL
jgi:hypothetical protein